MIAGFAGADVAQLRELARRFASAAEDLSRATRLTGSHVAAIPQWQGPAAVHFRARWSGELRPALLVTAQRLEAAAALLARNAADQERASRADAPVTATGAGARAPAADHTAWDPRQVLVHLDDWLVDAVRRAPEVIAWALGTAGRRAVQVVELDVLDGLDDLAFDQPVLTETAARLFPLALQAGVFALVPGGLVNLGGAFFVHALSGGRWPTTDFERTVDGLAEIGGRVGLLRDSGQFHVEPVPAADVPTAARPPAGIGEALEQQALLGRDQAQVQVVRREQPDGTTAWIVQIPGTQDWGAVRGANPFDLATDVALVAGRDTVAEHQAVAAMEAAGIGPHDPVLLTGHSQGGLTAAALASDAGLRDRFEVRAVLTVGSPIGRFDIPSDVRVLALEHRQDAVPMLEGRHNPSSWLTVRHDLTMTDLVAGGRTSEPSLEAAHDAAVYAATGARLDGSADPRVRDWRAAASDFFDGGSAAVERYRVAPGAAPTVRPV